MEFGEWKGGYGEGANCKWMEKEKGGEKRAGKESPIELNGIAQVSQFAELQFKLEVVWLHLHFIIGKFWNPDK